MTEKESMRQAAISVISLCNTKESFDKQKLKKDNPHWSVAYGDVCTAVQREITEKSRSAILLEALERCKDVMIITSADNKIVFIADEAIKKYNQYSV